MDEEVLRARIRHRIATGMLPAPAGNRVFGGRAEGGTCDGCGAEIVEPQVQYEVDFVPGLSGERVRTIILHRECHIIWVEESP